MLHFSHSNFIFFVILATVFLAACDDMHDVPTPVSLPRTPGEKGILFVLSEGLFNMNNSTLCNINFDNRTIETDFFTNINGRGLGDTANDMEFYDHLLWIVVNVSSQVEIVDPNTGTSIRRIPIFNPDGMARQPRFIAFDKQKAYVCSFDGTVSRIDISSLKVDAVTTCGRNPDGIAFANDKLYVSNSGGLDQPNYDHTISVIDINSFVEIKKIDVGLNPYKLQADSQGDIYVISRGNNGSIKPTWSKINTKTDLVERVFTDLPVTNFCIRNDTAFMYNFDYQTNLFDLKTFDCKKEQLITAHFVTDSTKIERPYAIYANPKNGHIYIADARNYTVKGNLLCFNSNGKLLYTLNSIGLNPNSVIALP